MKIQNASVLPKIYYGLHMVEGVAEYRPKDGNPYRILISEQAVKDMDPSYSGRPVYVKHVDEVDLARIGEADGFVVESFFNKSDGKHWVKFIAVTDAAHAAIAKGWRLSNAYVPKAFAGGGQWHGVDYDKEVMAGEYEHLAIVDNPRYAESVVLTPEDFKEYNANKELELVRLANSSDKGDPPMFDLFKKQKAENSADLVGMSVVLPKSKRERTIVQLVNEADAAAMAEGTDQYANTDHKVKYGDEEITVNELINRCMALRSELEELKQKDPASVKDPAAVKENEKKEEGDGEAKDDKKNADPEKEKEEAKKNAADAEQRRKNFEKLKNAPDKAADHMQVLDTSDVQVARGKARYGS